MVVCERLVALLVVGTSLASAHIYTSQWAAHIQGGYQQAQLIAEKHGFTLLAQIFPDYYHLEHRRIAKRSLVPTLDHHENLLSEKQVKWAEQQRIRRRVKRDQTEKLKEPLAPYHVTLNDPRWPQMWYLNRGSGLDMGVEGAWLDGITGKGIVVTILDDGLEKDHPDLQLNYDPEASYDVNGHDENPSPRYDLIDSNRHGTRCAGEVAAVANNSLCSVGIAYRASVGGVRMLDGDVTDAVEARSLSLNSQHIDIYSASWGPDDDGKTVDGPGELATRAFIEGVTKGRSGKGSIFVWASGNGGRDHDNCNCDGYTNSIWTLSISSATENGMVPWYSEACSSTLATTYSSGSTGEKQIVTTDLHHGCTSSHTGTSASAPLAAGICALALEANRALTWRDMQHIVVATARPSNLKAPDWTTNGVGRNVSHSFGYGLMDAAAMVRLARTWKTVPEQHKCEVFAPQVDKMIPAKSSVTLQLNVKECAGVNYLEHVQAKITLMTQRRGDVEIQLVSPVGTRTTLLARRPQDTSRSGFRSWPFMSVHTWGESPYGLWTLEIHNEGKYFGRATLQEWALMFYGTDTPPPGYHGRVTARPDLPLPTIATASPQQTKKNKPRKNNKPLKSKKTQQQGKTRKTPRPSVIQARRPVVSTVAPTPPPVGLTILLAPPPQPHANSFPAVFQRYSKVQQLYPYSSIHQPPPRPRKTNNQSQARLSDWNLIFYGTETAPMISPDSGATRPPAVHEPETNSIESTGWGRPPHTDFADFGASPCTKKGPDNACIECMEGYYLSGVECLNISSVVCAIGWYRDQNNKCNECHYSCFNCTGPYNHQCISCHLDGYLTSTNSQNYCVNLALKSLLQDQVWLIRIFVILSINLVLLITFICFTYLRHKGCRQSESQHFYSQNLLNNTQRGYSKLSKEDDLSDNDN